MLKQAEGYYGGRSRLYRTAKEAVLRAGVYAFRDRRQRKRQFRRLWVTRLSAAAEQRGLRYAELIPLLKRAGIALDRKSLAEVAVRDPRAFDTIVEVARGAVA